jgi:hypothetical protein
VGRIVNRGENGGMPLGQTNLVCQVAFVEWTDAGHLRHCTFVGMREEENPATSSNRARDDVFSYLVAGRLLSAGVPVVAVEGTIARNETCESEADVTFQLGDMLIDIECKRQCSSRPAHHAPTAD